MITQDGRLNGNIEGKKEQKADFLITKNTILKVKIYKVALHLRTYGKVHGQPQKIQERKYVV